MSEPNAKWYQSPAVIGLVITAAGFGLFTLAFFAYGEWVLRR